VTDQGWFWNFDNFNQTADEEIWLQWIRVFWLLVSVQVLDAAIFLFYMMVLFFLNFCPEQLFCRYKSSMVRVLILFSFAILLAPGSVASDSCSKTGSLRQVVILPPTGGVNSADKALFKALCQRGHEVHILDYQQKSVLTSDLKIHDELSREVLGEINQFLKHTQKPTILVGASLGGLYASLAFGYSFEHLEAPSVEPPEFPDLLWIRAVVLTVAGGSLAEILAQSDLKPVREQRNLRFNELGLVDLNDYKGRLNSAITYDPMKWAKPSERNRVLMFISENDNVVPSQTQEKLWKAWGEPPVIRLSTNHQLSIGFVYFFLSERIDKFLRTLP